MATRNADIAAIQAAPTPSTLLSGLQVSGQLYTARIIVTTVTGEAADDIVRLIKLPKGAQPVPGLSYIISGGGGSGATWTVDIGDDDDTVAAADVDRYCDGANVAAAGRDFFIDPVIPAAETTPYTLQKESWITLTHATFNTVTVGSKLYVRLVWVGI